MEPEKEKESEKEKKKRKPAAKSKDSRGLSVVLYRNCKARFYSETCFQETTSSFESTACNIKSIYSQSSSVKQWLNEFCPEFEDNCLLNVKDDEGLVHKLNNFQAMATSTRTSTMNPIDVSSIEEIKALKIEKMSQASIFEKCYGFDFDFYLNAGGPIYSSSFAPSNGIVNSDQHTSGSSYDKFLAVGLSRVGWPAQSTSTLDGSAGVRADSRRVLGERDKSDNLLQIWHLSGSVHFERQPVTYKLFQKGIVAGNHGKNIGRPKGSKNKKGVIADKKKETTENTQRKKKGIIESDDEENEGSDDAEGEDASRVNSSKKQKHASADSAELEPIDIVVVPASCSSSSKATAGAAASGSTSASLEPQSGFEVKLNNVQALFDEYFQEVKRDLDNEETAASPAVAAPNLVFAYGVHLESRGPVWQMAWCPVLLSSGAASAADDDDTFTSADALGVLAVVCGDGSCLVLVLPRLTHLSSSSTDSTDLDEVPVLAETSVCRVEISQPGDMVSSLCWNPHKPFELMCGMMSGVIGIYSLTPYLTSTLDGDGVATVQLTMPDACLCDPEVDTATPCYGAITTLQMCPYRDNWLLSGGCDGNLKVWDLHRPFLPLLVKEGRNTVSQVAWDPCGMGLYSADLSSTSVIVISVTLYACVTSLLLDFLGKMDGNC